MILFFSFIRGLSCKCEDQIIILYFLSVLYVKLPRRLIHFLGLSALFFVKKNRKLKYFLQSKISAKGTIEQVSLLNGPTSLWPRRR
jgi:hypothetical protein